MAQINMATEDWVNAQGFAKEGTVFHYMGSVETVAALEAITTKSIGDVYNVKATGANYVWTGTPGDPQKPHQIGWDKLSETIIVTDSFTENITNEGEDAEKATKSKAVYAALQGKVDKVSGKQLSTEDFTTSEKEKLDSMLQIDTVDEEQFSVDTASHKLSISAIEMDTVTGLGTALAGKVDKVEGQGLSDENFTAAHKAKLEAMVEIDSVDTAQMTVNASTKKLSITAIDQSVVTGLDDALDSKVDKVEGYGLSKNDLTDARKNKLDAMVEVDSVDTAQMTIDSSKKLSITAIAQSVVTGLEDSLDSKVDKVEGQGLSDENFTNEHKTKLEALANIETVDANTLEITDDAQLKVKAVSMGIVTGLEDALDGKVDKVSGKQLSTEDFTTAHKTKLEAMAEIDSVESTQMSIDSSTKKLSITAIAQTVVTGLGDALDEKVDKVEGYGLSKNDLTDARKNKLDAMVEIDSVDSDQLSVSASKELSITAVDMGIVTGLDTALSNITTDITNMCNGTKAFTGIKFAYNSKFYTLAVATNTLGQPTLYLEEIVG